MPDSRVDPVLYMKLQYLAREMRHDPTPAENALWQCLRNSAHHGIKFRRQHVLGQFIVDFIALRPRLVIEVDGPIHQYTPVEDLIRQEYIETVHHLRVMRFTNDEVLYQMPLVLARIDEHFYLS